MNATEVIEAQRFRRASVNSNASTQRLLPEADRMRRSSNFSAGLPAVADYPHAPRSHRSSDHSAGWRSRRSSQSWRERRGSRHTDYTGSESDIDPTERWLLETVATPDQAALELEAGLGGTAWDTLPTHLRNALLAEMSARRREQRAQKTEELSDTCSHKHRICRHKLDQFLESSLTQSLLVLLVIIETIAVTVELLVERNYLTIAAPNEDCRLEGSRACPCDRTLYSIMQTTSMSILCLFEIEFLLMWYAEGCRCCCKPGIQWILLDVVVVTLALVTEIWVIIIINSSKEIDSRIVIFVVVLRIIRILNGMFQQYLRSKKINHELLEAAKEELEHRYLEMIRQLIHHTDGIQAELCHWRNEASAYEQLSSDLEALAKLKQAKLDEKHAMDRGASDENGLEASELETELLQRKNEAASGSALSTGKDTGVDLINDAKIAHGMNSSLHDGSAREPDPDIKELVTPQETQANAKPHEG
eukprot:SAG31_NODE_387_length_16403_cov_5.062071_6_plen_476_part_00